MEVAKLRREQAYTAILKTGTWIAGELFEQIENEIALCWELQTIAKLGPLPVIGGAA